MEEFSDEEKKKPGRPRKKQVRNIMPKLGIVKEPSNNKHVDTRLHNVYEIIYDNPLMFKRIFSLFKSMSVDNIRLKLEPEYVKMHALDHSQNNDIYIKIIGSRLNRYYLNKPLEFGLASNDIQKILQTLSKDHANIWWFSQEINSASKMKIRLDNDDMEENSVYTVDIQTIDGFNWESLENQIEDEKHYPIKFNLPFKYFKKKIADFDILGEIMKIEKYSDGQLMLSYTFKNKKGEHSTRFNNNSKIKLDSKLEYGNIFSTSVYLEHIKPIASSLVSESISISADLEKKLIFTALLDQDEKSNSQAIPDSEKCIIKVLTNIVKIKDF